MNNLYQNTPFSCTPELLERIDEAAQRFTLTRSAWLRQAALEKLNRDSRPEIIGLGSVDLIVEGFHGMVE